MAFIRSISGLRATLGDDLLPERVAAYAAAFGTMLPDGAIVVGRDGRPSGAWIEHIVCGALAACGREVIRLGMVPTPTVQLFAEKEGIAGGIAITASHNPEQWNGLKFLNGRGIFLDAEENQQLWDIVDNGTARLVTTQQGGTISEEPDAIATHITALLSLPAFAADDEALTATIRSRKLRVVVDAVNSSGSSIVPALLLQLGCEIIPLYCDGSGIFPHTPEPLPENLGSLAHAVTAHGADLGIAVDPDADRLVLIDETGHPIGEENTVVLSVLSVLENADAFGQSSSPSVAVNLSTTRAVEDIAARFGATVHRTPVGEINVVKAMLEHGSVIGGEGSGGVILPSCHAGRDSLVGIALVLLLLAQKNLPLSALVHELPQYTIVKKKKAIQGDPTGLFDALQQQYPDVESTRADGLKFIFAQSWVHLRASNTEPIVRIIAEAPTSEQAEQLAEEFARALP
jgi:phosphomannomutase